MTSAERREIPRLGTPEITGRQAEERDLVWATPQSTEPALPVWKNRLLVPEKWVDDAISGALAQYHDDIVEMVKAELRQRMEEFKAE